MLHFLQDWTNDTWTTLSISPKPCQYMSLIFVRILSQWDFEISVTLVIALSYPRRHEFWMQSYPRHSGKVLDADFTCLHAMNLQNYESGESYIVDFMGTVIKEPVNSLKLKKKIKNLLKGIVCIHHFDEGRTRVIHLPSSRYYTVNILVVVFAWFLDSLHFYWQR